MPSRKLPFIGSALLTIPMLTGSGCNSSVEHQHALREALTQAPVSEVSRSPASSARPISPAEPNPGLETPQALNQLADQLTHNLRTATWLEAPADTDSTGEDQTEDEGETEVVTRAVRAPAVCSSVEYAGQGTLVTHPTEAASSAPDHVQAAFQDAKNSLLGWLRLHRDHFPASTYAFLESRMRATKLRPSSVDADLAWRGVGIWTRDPASDEPVIKVGGGFATLMSKQPDRAKFELTRLLAQTWSPCELERKKVAQPWSAYLRCMGYAPSDAPEQLGCAQGGYSEAGWAVSSAVATSIADPGCQIPAFNEPGRAECPRAFLLPLVMNATTTQRPASETQEARQ